ncbi:T9SS type A sorting domain-containing protein [bacterium]|nr:T9SS type A sorting domain-containing protein [bacterium]
MKKMILIIILCISAFSPKAEADDFSITIDGQKDAFYEGLTGQADGLVFMPARCYLRDILAPADEGDEDISAVIWMAWDDEYLYYYGEVLDDVVTAANSERYLNDCVEIKYDPDPTSGEGTGTSNCRLTALGEEDAENPAGVDNLNGSKHLEDEAGVDYEPYDTDYARRSMDGGYAFEFRVPLDYINEPEDGRFMVRGEGEIFGMAVNIGDNDSGTRDHMLQWSAGHTDGVHSNALYCGSVTFLPDHKLRLEAVSPRDETVKNDSAAVWYENPNPSGIDVQGRQAESFRILSNYPNPFNPGTVITYEIRKTEIASLEVYHATGRLIRLLAVDRMHAPGFYEMSWDGRDDAGHPANNGIYLCRFRTPDQVRSIKMMLVK